MQKATTFTHKKHKEINRNECKKQQNTKQNRRECKAASEWGALYDCQPVRKGTPGEVPDKANNKSHLNSSFLKTCSFIFIQFYSKHPVFRCKINLDLSGIITIFIEIRLPLVKNNSSNKGLKAFEVGIEKAHWARDLIVLYLRWVYLGSGWNFNSTWEL